MCGKYVLFCNWEVNLDACVSLLNIIGVSYKDCHNEIIDKQNFHNGFQREKIIIMAVKFLQI